jgi:hypothetical protein
MKRLLYLFGLALAMIIMGCDDADPQPQIDTRPGELKLNFKANFDDTPLVMYESEYPYEAGVDIKLQLFQFYLTDITLIGDTIGEVPVSDIELVSFKEIYTMEDAEKGIDLTFTDIPSGQYDRIRFGIGVNPELNATEPGDYQIGHPLTDNYWSAAAGYVFFKIEGNADLNGDDVFDDKLTFHIGKNEYLRESTLEETFVMPANGMATMSFDIDLYDVLREAGSGEFLDFNETLTDHTTNPEVAQFLADNLKNAIQISK